MAEENNLNEVPASNESENNFVANTTKNEVHQKVEETPSSETNHETHKPSNLRGRWKRTSGVATIKEDDSKLPKEIKTVKIETAEKLETVRPTHAVRNEKRSERKSVKKEKEEQQKKCCCCSCLCKIKRFILGVFGIKSKHEKCSFNHSRKGGYRNHHRNYRSRRPNHRNHSAQ